MYLTETHMHTAEGSACASATGSQQAEQYKAAGYDTIIITDHFLNGNTAVDRSLPWAEQVAQYCLGYEHAKQRGDEIGLTVLFGIEYAWHGADFLMYGIDKQWLLDRPDSIEISPHEFCDRVHESGGVVVHAHPFREAGYLRDMKFLPWHTDGVEVFNSGNGSEKYNERARWYAKEYDMVMTAGSDCHHLGFQRFAGVYSDFKIETIGDYCELIRSNGIGGLKTAEKLL